MGLVAFSDSGVVLEINSSAAGVLAREPGQMAGEPFTRFLPGDQVLAFINHLRRCRQAEEPVSTELRALAADGSQVVIELVSAPIPNHGSGFQCPTILRDLTARKNVQGAWLESERNYNELVNSIDGIVWEGLPQKFNFVSGQSRAMLGYPPMRWMDEPCFWESRLHPADREHVLEARRRAFAQKIGYTMEFRMLDAQGRVVWLRDNASISHDAQGKPLFRGIMVNITDVKAAGEALREEMRRLETINRMGQLLTGQIDFNKLMSVIADAGKQLTGAKFGAFFYNHADKTHHELSAYTTPEAGREMFDRLPRPNHHPGASPNEVEREAIRMDDFQSAPGTDAPKNVRSFLAVPVVSTSDELAGALVFADPAPGHFSERAQHLLSGFAAEAGIVLENARLCREVSRSETHFRQLADAMPQIVWTADANGNVNYFNQRWYNYTGDPDGVKPDGWLPFLHADDCGRCSDAWKKSVASGEALQLECRLRGRGADSYRWHLIRAVPNRDEQGQIAGWFGTCTDIEDQKRVESEIRELNAALEHRVADRTAQLQASNKELEAFSYSVSHDLRAPLRSIDAFNQLAREDYGDRLGEQGRQYLDIVAKASKQMARLIDDLLYLSRVTRSQIRREPVDLTALAEGILANLKQVEPDRKVETVVAPGLCAQGDLQLLRVALENLLNNAWKFTSRREQARIEVGSGIHDGQRVFFVRDNGAGFDMHYVTRLFGAFQRLHSAEEFPGHGIGLATVQRIIHRHGGRIWVNAAVDQGATFFFTLPE